MEGKRREGNGMEWKRRKGKKNDNNNVNNNNNKQWIYIAPVPSSSEELYSKL